MDALSEQDEGGRSCSESGCEVTSDASTESGAQYPPSSSDSARFISNIKLCGRRYSAAVEAW